MPGDIRVEGKEQDILDKYQNLAQELRKLWKVNTIIIRIIISALGTTSVEKNPKRAGTI